jgi:Na+-driven multidrug efflux pump
MIATYGIDAVAGFGIAMRIEPMALIPFYALSGVSSPFAGQNIAAGEFQRLFEARRVATWFCLGFGVFLVLVFGLFAGPVTRLFSETEAIQEIAVQYLWIVAASYGAYGLVMSVCATFNGIGMPFPGVAISASRVIFIFLPLAFIGRWLFDLPGLFVAAAVANVMAGIWAYIWLGQRMAAAQSAS